MPDIWGLLIGTGTYYAEATIKNPDGSPMTCLYVRVEVFFTENPKTTTNYYSLKPTTTSTTTTTSLGLALSGLTASLGLVLFSALFQIY